MSSELASKLNNKSVELFVKGKLNSEQLATFSVDLANSADKYAETNLAILQNRPQDQVDTWKRGEFTKIEGAKNIAKECRDRAVMITMAKPPTPK